MRVKQTNSVLHHELNKLADVGVTGVRVYHIIGDNLWVTLSNLNHYEGGLKISEALVMEEVEMADKRVHFAQAHSSGVRLIKAIAEKVAHLPSELQKCLQELLVR